MKILIEKKDDCKVASFYSKEIKGIPLCRFTFEEKENTFSLDNAVNLDFLHLVEELYLAGKNNDTIFVVERNSDG